MNSLNRKKNHKKIKQEEFIEDKINDSNPDNINTDFSKTVFEKFTDKIKNFLENAE